MLGGRDDSWRERKCGNEQKRMNFIMLGGNNGGPKKPNNVEYGKVCDLE